MPQHHLAGKDYRPRIDLIEVGVLGRRAVRRFEDGVTGHVVDVAAGRDADAADLRGERIRQVVAVQVWRGDDVEFVGPRQDLLQRDVGDGVLDHDAGAGFTLRNPAPGPAVDFLGAEELLRDLVSPITKRPFGELHDVPLVDERDAFPFGLDRVADGAVNQPLGPEVADWLETHPHLNTDGALRRTDFFEGPLPAHRGVRRAEADLLELLRKFLREKVQQFLRFRRAGGILDSGVDVFGVLAEDHHVDLFGVLHR